MTIRLLVEGNIRPAGGIVRAGFDEFRWPRPVRPGDELRVESEVLEVRPSKSRPEQGLIKVRVTTPTPWSGRIEARTGLRMMPTSPRSPLSFRTAGFPQYG